MGWKKFIADLHSGLKLDGTSTMVLKGTGRTETRPSWLDTFGSSNPMILLLPTVLTGKSLTRVKPSIPLLGFTYRLCLK